MNETIKKTKNDFEVIKNKELENEIFRLKQQSAQLHHRKLNVDCAIIELERRLNA